MSALPASVIPSWLQSFMRHGYCTSLRYFWESQIFEETWNDYLEVEGEKIDKGSIRLSALFAIFLHFLGKVLSTNFFHTNETKKVII